LEISEIVSLLYIAKNYSVRVAIDLIKSEIRLSPRHQITPIHPITKWQLHP